MGSPAKAISFLTDLTSWHSQTFRPDTTRNFDTTALAGLQIITVSPGRMLCELPVAPRVQNRFGSLHGGCLGKIQSLSILENCQTQIEMHYGKS